MSNPTRTRRPRGSRTRQLQPVTTDQLTRFRSRRRDAAYAAGVDYMVGLMALHSR